MDVVDVEDARILVGGVEGSMDVLVVENAIILAGFGVGTAEKLTVTRSLGLMVPADEDDVIGGNPRMEPFV